MRYTLFLHYPELTPDELGPEALEAGQAAFHAYASALDEAGVLVSAEVLRPSAESTTVTIRDGRRRILDGPFTETKEQIGGTFVLDVPDLEAALDWAAKAPAAEWGAVEVRPSAVRFVDGEWVAVEPEMPVQ